MRPSGDNLAFDQGVLGEIFDGSEVGEGVAPSPWNAHESHFVGSVRSSANWCVDRTTVGPRVTVHEGEVPLLDCAVTELRLQECQCALVLGDDDQAGSVTVETVNDTGTNGAIDCL